MANNRIPDGEGILHADDFSLNDLIENALRSRTNKIEPRETGIRYETGPLEKLQEDNATDSALDSLNSLNRKLTHSNPTLSSWKDSAEFAAEELPDDDFAPEELPDDDFADTEENPEENEEELSIEQMVARAMKKKNLAAMALSPERIATSADIIDSSFDEENEETDSRSFFARHKKKIITISSISAVFVVLIGAIIALFVHFYGLVGDLDNSKKNREQEAIGADDTVNANSYDQELLNSLKTGNAIMSDENVMNVLLVAEDLRDTSGDSRGNTDVMMLISVNKTTEEITLTSFMRDIYLQIPGYYATRLNAAYEIGGTDLLKDTIAQNFGVEIDRCVVVNFYSFMDIVDAVGGLDFEISDAEANAMRAPLAEQNKLLGNDYGTDYLTSGGSYHLNPNQALAYCRIRYNVGDDYGRTQRQRNAIEQMIEKAKGLSITELSDLMETILPQVSTDITQSEASQLLYDLFTSYKNYTREQLQIPATETFSTQTIRDMQVLCPNFASNTKILQETIYGSSNVSQNEIDSGDFVNSYTQTQPVYTDSESEDTEEPSYTEPEYYETEEQTDPPAVDTEETTTPRTTKATTTTTTMSKTQAEPTTVTTTAPPTTQKPAETTSAAPAVTEAPKSETTADTNSVSENASQ